MNNQNDTQTNGIGNEQTNFFMAVTNLFGKIYSTGGGLPEPTKSYRDVTVPFVALLIMSSLFLLTYNFLPLFGTPSKAISIHRVMDLTAEQMRLYPVYSLFTQHWVILALFVIGWISIIFLVHMGNTTAQTYMMGITSVVLVIVLVFILLRFMVGLFFIKAMQVWDWNAAIVNWKVAGFLVRDALMWLFLLPCFGVIGVVYKEVGRRGIVALGLFGGLLAVLYIMFDYYSPIRKHETKISSRIGNPPDDHKTAYVPSKVVDSTNKKKSKLEVDSLLNDIILTGEKGDEKPIQFNLYYGREMYKLVTTIVVSNNSSEAIKLPFYKLVRLNIIADNVRFRMQENDQSEDFVFSMYTEKLKDIATLDIQPHSNKIIKLKAEISHNTYDYMLRYMRENDILDFEVKFNIVLEHLNKSIDIASKKNVQFKFANGEVYGYIKKYN